ncbi:MAG TPA: FAD-dependent oxidoreductase [Firmicutes bacterium]|nr:FAD-dependent oxidoreductase [Bacillota bacterium]
MNYDYLIIGNSTAAVGCIEGIRAVDDQGSVCVVTDENYRVYGRPLISYILWGKTTEEKALEYRPADFYEKNNVELILGVKATKIDPKKKTVALSNGETIGYSRLLCATGSRPFVPPMGGLETVEKKFNFMTMDDAKALDEAVTEDSRVLIIGAGLIGLKCAEGISGKTRNIKVVDLADRILPSILDKKGSEIVQKYIEEQGVEFYLNNSAAKLENGKATLKNGEEIEFDVLVVAVGVRANTELVAEAGGEVNRGIVTDLRCETTLKDVYAAGDCAESYDITTDTSRVLALLPNAYKQGYAAGVNMAGGDKPYDDAMPMNAIGFFGLHVITAGSYDGEEVVSGEGNVYKKLVIKDNKLVGYIMIGDILRAGIYTRLIREQIPLDEVDYELMLSRPAEMIFPKAVRANDVGGAKL